MKVFERVEKKKAIKWIVKFDADYAYARFKLMTMIKALPQFLSPLVLISLVTIDQQLWPHCIQNGYSECNKVKWVPRAWLYLHDNYEAINLCGWIILGEHKYLCSKLTTFIESTWFASPFLWRFLHLITAFMEARSTQTRWEIGKGRVL